MIVMIYGTPRSGKSTLIDQLMVYYTGKAVHLKLSKIMNEIAMNSYNEHFSEDMPTDKKNFLYQEAKKIINHHNETSKYVFMDCHAGYLSKNGEFYDFRTNDYHNIGHLYFYLKTDAEVVYERMLKNPAVFPGRSCKCPGCIGFSTVCLWKNLWIMWITAP